MGFGASGMPGRRWMPAGFVQSPLGGCRRRSRRYLIGTMIEVPRGAVTADEIAKEAEFLSFVTLDASGVGLLVEIGVKKGRRVVLPVPSADRRLAAAQAQLESKASD